MVHGEALKCSSCLDSKTKRVRRYGEEAREILENPDVKDAIVVYAGFSLCWDHLMKLYPYAEDGKSGSPSRN